MNLRPDAPLVRHIAETHTVAAARAWQNLPYALLPGEAFADYAIHHSRALAAAMPRVTELPWQDVVFDSPTGLAPLLDASVDQARELFETPEEWQSADLTRVLGSRGRCWFRLTDGAHYLQQAPVMSPWLAGPADMLAFARAQPDHWLALELWEQRTVQQSGGRGLPAYPDVTLIPKSAPWDQTRWASLYPNLACRSGRAYGAGFCNIAHCRFPDGSRIAVPCVDSALVMGIGVLLALSTLAYLLGMDEYLVEVSPVLTANQRKQAGRSASGSKPWARPGLPYFILIDPQRAREYGHPAAMDAGGTHASPRPHHRRGHWRELRAERYQHAEDGSALRSWVKPAWIGALSWEANGAAYKVVPPRF